MKYRWSEGSRFTGLDAEAVGRRIEELRDRLNVEGLTPKQVVADARDRASPLHRAFEWNDKKAGELYRETQARSLLRSLVIVREKQIREDSPQTKIVTARAFSHLASQGGYMPTEVALERTNTRTEMLARAWAELAQWRKRYQDLKEFAELIELIDQLEEKVAHG